MTPSVLTFMNFGSLVVNSIHTCSILCHKVNVRVPCVRSHLGARGLYHTDTDVAIRIMSHCGLCLVS